MLASLRTVVSSVMGGLVVVALALWFVREGGRADLASALASPPS